MSLEKYSYSRNNSNNNAELNVVGFFLSNSYDSVQGNTSRVNSNEVKSTLEMIADTNKVFKKVLSSSFSPIEFKSFNILSATSKEEGYKAISKFTNQKVQLVLVSSHQYDRLANYGKIIHPNHITSEIIESLVQNGYDGSFIAININSAEKNSLKGKLRDKISVIDSLHYKQELEKALYDRLKLMNYHNNNNQSRQ